jgi:hypothetical protein
MTTKIENEILCLAIYNESRLTIKPIDKQIVATSLVVAAFGAIMVGFDVHYGGIYLIMGFGVFLSCLFSTPKPSRYDDNNFRHQPLSVKTIEQIRSTVGAEVIQNLLVLKEKNPEKCLRVEHLFKVIESYEKTANETIITGIAQEQLAALIEQH